MLVNVKDVNFKMGETAFKIYDQTCIYAGTDIKRELIIGQVLPTRENIEISFRDNIEIVKIDNFKEFSKNLS